MGLGGRNLPGCGTDRRTALRIALGAALLPMLAPRPAFALGDVPIAPPAREMIYRRTLARQLSGGATFRVTRDFAVRFLPLDGGFQVEGRQIAARVEAPAHLARFAALEEQRVESGVFPLILDHAGRIVDGTEASPSHEFALALDEVRRRHGQNGDEVETLIEALHSTGLRLTSQLPSDLFAPTEVPRLAREEIVLPWGDRGEVVTSFEGLRDPATGLMHSARREVVTRLDGDERSSGEEWGLFPA